MLVVILTCQTTNSGNKLIGLFALSALSTQRPKSWHSVTRMEENKQNQRIVAKNQFINKYFKKWPPSEAKLG